MNQITTKEGRFQIRKGLFNQISIKNVSKNEIKEMKLKSILLKHLLKKKIFFFFFFFFFFEEPHKLIPMVSFKNNIK